MIEVRCDLLQWTVSSFAIIQTVGQPVLAVLSGILQRIFIDALILKSQRNPAVNQNRGDEHIKPSVQVRTHRSSLSHFSSQFDSGRQVAESYIAIRYGSMSGMVCP